MKLSQVVINPVFPLWAVLLLFLLGAAAAVLQYRLLRPRVGRRRAIGLALLRLGAWTLVVAFALNPSLVGREEHRIAPTLAVLLDTSPSMGFAAKAGSGSRLEEARNLLLAGKDPLLKSLSERFQVQLFALGESLRPLEPGELAELRPGRQKADLSAALEELAARSSLALLLSDGNLPWKEGQAATIPLLTVPVGDPASYQDLLILAVKGPAMAFRGREVAFDVVLKSRGFKKRSIPVVLKEGEKILAARTVDVEEGPGGAAVSLSFTPTETGRRTLTVAIPPQVGEATHANNTARISLNVVRDKIRILMVSGHASLNYRTLRAALKSDPSIDLLSFILLRTPANILNVPVEEQSLIPLPVDTLFTKELREFDLLIFDDFPYHPYLRPGNWEAAREFVRQGGGIAMIGGANFSHESGLGAVLDEILPVKISGKGEYLRTSPWEVQATRSGRVHPLIRLLPAEGDNVKLWREMPPLNGINPLDAKPAGAVLLASSDGSFRPVLTVGGYGKGRTLVLATDESWKWYMGLVARGKDSGPYLRFMAQMVRWLTRDPSLDPIQMTLVEGTAGRRREIRIRVREEENVVTLTVFNPDGVKIESQLRAGAAGEYLGSFPAEKAGIYRFKAEARSGPKEESFFISGPAEDPDPAPDHERLRTAAAATGGKALSGGENLVKEIERLSAGRENRWIEEKRSPLWGNFYVLALVLALLAGEWFLRRRWGLI